MEISPRLVRWIKQNFEDGSTSEVLETLRDLPPAVIGGQDEERVQASLVIGTGGDWQSFQRALAVATIDWRDALVGAGLGNADWPKRLDAALGNG